MSSLVADATPIIQTLEAVPALKGRAKLIWPLTRQEEYASGAFRPFAFHSLPRTRIMAGIRGPECIRSLPVGIKLFAHSKPKGRKAGRVGFDRTPTKDDSLMNEFQSQNQRYSQTPSWSEQGGWGGLLARSAAEASLPERLAFIRKVYSLFFAATLFAIGGVLMGFAYEPLMVFSLEHPIIMLLAMIGSVMGATAVRHKPGINLVALFEFTTLTGVIISPLFWIISSTNPASILQAGI